MAGSNGTAKGRLTRGDPLLAIEMQALGRTGLQTWGGRVYEEWLPELRGPAWVRTVREMVDNDPTTGSILFAIEMLIRQVTWRNQAANDSTEAQKARDLFDQIMLDGDMEVSWPDTLSEITTFLPWGWSLLEILPKYRQGDQRDPTRKSKYSDGMVGLRKLSLRSQDSLYRWVFDEEGGVEAMVQQVVSDSTLRVVPLAKSCLFRTTTRKGTPEGRSILRNSWRAWVFKKRLEVIEGIGIERDAAGLPMGLIPSKFMRPDASDADKAYYEFLQEQISSIRRDEREGLLWPSDRDENGNPLYEFKLVSSGGQRQIDVGSVIDRKKQEQAMTVLADVILMGHERVGSYNLADSKTNLLAYALGAWLDCVAEVINQQLYPTLARWNGLDASVIPSLEHGDVESVDLSELGDFISKMAAAGAPLFTGDPAQELYRHLLSVAKLPEPTDAEVQAYQDEEQANQEMAAQLQAAQAAQPPATAPNGAPAEQNPVPAGAGQGGQ